MSGETRYARSGDLRIAYQVIGDGPIDLVFAPGYLTHLEQNQWWPSYASLLERMASFSRLIVFDRRGTGLSDRILSLGSFEELLDDITAVLDAASSERAALFGGAESGPMCALYAATFPERVSALVLGASYPRRTVAPGFPWGFDEERQAQVMTAYDTKWGTPSFGLRSLAPTLADDERFQEWYAQACRFAGTPASAIAWFRITMEIDVRDVLPAIRVPTLVIHRTDDRVVPVGAGRYLADNIPGARLLELSGADHFPFSGDFEPALEEIEEFLTGSRRGREPDRVLATMLFTDIVGSTERAVELGDQRWKELLADHHRIVRDALGDHRGNEVRLTGDGFLATFDGPARAIRCAEAIRDGVRSLGLEIRAGLHTGEIELASSGVEGVAVHIGARVSSLAGASEILVSSTVKDLVVGSGVSFEDRGAHTLKGVPGEWRVYAVA